MTRYSYSRLGAFRTCPLQYKFRYVDRIKVEVGPSIEAFMGSRVHDALEWLYDQVRNARTPTAEQVLTVYETTWQKEWSDDVRVVKKEFAADDYRHVGQECLKMYCARHHPYDDGIVLGLEEGFAIPLSESAILNGFIDRLMKKPGDMYEVHDYKTSQRLPTPEQAQADEQGGWYALAVKDRFPEASEVRLVWHYLRHDERLVTSRSERELHELKDDIEQRISLIEAEAVFPPQESALCNWCDYLAICPAKGHRLAVESMTKNEYMDEPGVALVNRLAELKSSLKQTTDEIESEIEKVTAALLHYAETNGYSVVVGDEMEAVVDFKEAISLPTKSMPEREALDNAIRQLGLWDDFSDLSTSRLSKALREGGLRADQTKALESYVNREKKQSVRLRRKQTN